MVLLSQKGTLVELGDRGINQAPRPALLTAQLMSSREPICAFCLYGELLPGVDMHFLWLSLSICGDDSVGSTSKVARP